MNQERAVFTHGCWMLLAGFLLLGGVVCSRAEIPVSGAECQAFGKELQSHIARKDILFYVNAFDMKGFMDTMESGEIKANLNTESLSGFEIGFRRGMEAQLSSMKSLKFLRVSQLDGQPSIMMRMLTTNGMLNYQNLSLKHDASGKVRIEDVYLYMSGEKLSDTTRRSLIPVLMDENKSVLEHLFSGTPDVVKYFKEWAPMGQLMMRGQNQQVLDTYAQLPESLQREKFILIMRLRAAQAVDRADYLATMRLWRQYFPDDPSIDIMSVDFYTLTRQYEEALNCLDRLDKSVGGDPYLDFERSAMYFLMKDNTNAEKFAKQAYAREPDLLQAGFLAISFMEKRQDFDGCVKMLQDMHTLGGYPESGLDRVLRGARNHANDPLIQSDAYQKWFYAIAGAPALTPMTVPSVTNH